MVAGDDSGRPFVVIGADKLREKDLMSVSQTLCSCAGGSIKHSHNVIMERKCGATSVLCSVVAYSQSHELCNVTAATSYSVTL